MKIEQKANCPLDGFNPCRKLDCAWFIEIRGSNPNTGEEISDWGCAITWLPILTIENSQQQRSTGAAVESFRNEMVKANNLNSQVLLATVSQIQPDLKIIENN
jgi:predicted glycosyltransferase